MPLGSSREALCRAVERNRVLRRVFQAQLRGFYAAKDRAADQAIIDLLAARDFRPEAVLVQISRACNLRCSMCGWAVWQRNKGFMPLDLYRRVISELKLNGIKNINLTNPQGEPLLSPHAAECIRLAVDAGLTVYLNTNCTPLSDRKIEELCDLAATGSLHIQASFSGYDKATHEAVYVGSRFETTSEKLRRLNMRLAERGLSDFLAVNGVITNSAELRRHVDFLVSLGIDERRITIGLPDNFGGIVEVGKKVKGRDFFSYKVNLPYRHLRLCNLLAYYVLIYDDGKVSACSCRDSEGIMEIGDITKESLFAIRNGERFKRMLTAFMKRDLSGMPLCAKCDIPYGDRENEKLFISGETQEMLQ